MWFSLCQRPPSAGGSLGQNPGPLGGDVVLCGCVVWWVAKLLGEGDRGTLPTCEHGLVVGSEFSWAGGQRTEGLAPEFLMTAGFPAVPAWYPAFCLAFRPHGCPPACSSVHMGRLVSSLVL